MEKLFLMVLNMSITTSPVILAVLLARRVLRNAPKVFSYVLWAVVLFRLLCPFTVMRGLAVIPNHSNIAQSFFEMLSYILQGNVEPADLTRIASILWLAGTAVLLGRSIWSTAKLRRRLAVFLPLEGVNNVRLVDCIPVPFVLGLFSPKIYLPSDLPESEREYILLHERTHIRRMDHITRSLAWLALAAHWFNPLVWLAFDLAGKDMEMSCDEAVLHKMDWWRIQTDYSASLLRLSAGGKLPAGPLSFGGGDLRRRIENILDYRTPERWAPVLAFAAVLLMGAALVSDPGGLIAPSSVVSCTQIPAIPSLSPQETIVYTAADRREDLQNPLDSLELRQEDCDELVRLVNSYRKTFYSRGELELSGSGKHFLFRIDCADGAFYLVDHWYCKEFSLIHGVEDYITLVTGYDTEGNAGITWRMEYYFDWAIQEWWCSLPEHIDWQYSLQHMKSERGD